MSDLERIAPTPRKITVAGGTIEVSPLRVRDLPAMARAFGASLYVLYVLV